jgi:hypothetical protein
MIYTAKYAHNGRDIPGTLKLSATDDAGAVAEIKAFVIAGLIASQPSDSGTWANVELSDGSACVYRNRFGKAEGGIAE